MKFFDPFNEIIHSKNRLPHWQQDGAPYFVTFRLADSLPAALLDRWRKERRVWLNFHPVPWTGETEKEYQKRFLSRIDQDLDASHGSCVLGQDNCAHAVEQTLRRFDGERYDLIASVVMPNHVHALFAPAAKRSVEDILSSWKTFSARRVNQINGRKGALWQKDYFDRLVRDEKHLARCIRYIRNNPVKAKLRPDTFALYESEFARSL